MVVVVAVGLVAGLFLILKSSIWVYLTRLFSQLSQLKLASGPTRKVLKGSSTPGAPEAIALVHAVITIHF